MINALCIFGPLDGKSYPTKNGPPTVPVETPASTVYPGNEPMTATATVDCVSYREFTMRQPFGGWVTVYAPHGTSETDLKAELNRRYPQGLE